MALALSACVVAGPPDYRDPTQTPPMLDLAAASPDISKVIQAHTPVAGQPATSIQISVPVRSQDPSKDGLFGLLYLDYNTDNETLYPTFWSIPASTFDDTHRLPVTFNWTPANVSDGCHTLTIKVSHMSNVSFQGQPTITPPKDHPDDLAFATWWVDVNPENQNPMSDCPTQSP